MSPLPYGKPGSRRAAPISVLDQARRVAASQADAFAGSTVPDTTSDYHRAVGGDGLRVPAEHAALRSEHEHELSTTHLITAAWRTPNILL